MQLSPFWRYYGGKYRAAKHYPKPKYDAIVEPFAGAAGYALHYADREVVLVEKYHVVAEVWKYLVSCDPAEVMSTPIDIDNVSEVPDRLPQGLRWLIGLTMGNGRASPGQTLSAGLRKFRESGYRFSGWSAAQRERVAQQIPHIRHWRVIEGDYTAAPDVCATWFVDPPYQRAGVHYPCSSKDIDYRALGRWSVGRRGQTIVCENAGADWLPFCPCYDTHTAMNHNSRSSEVVWEGGVLLPGDAW